MSLKKFIAQENQMAALWGNGRLPTYPENTSLLTPEQKKQLADNLLSALSPENLCCDGELRGARLRSKANLLNKAKSDLEALGQRVEWDFA